MQFSAEREIIWNLNCVDCVWGKKDTVGVKYVCVYFPDGMDASHYTVRRDGEVWKMREDTAKCHTACVAVIFHLATLLRITLITLGLLYFY